MQKGVLDLKLPNGNSISQIFYSKLNERKEQVLKYKIWLTSFLLKLSISFFISFNILISKHNLR